MNIVGALDTMRGGPDDNSAQAGHIVAGTVRSHVRPGSNDVGGIITHTLAAEGFDASEDGTGRGTPLTAPAGSVRRLTPTECERLQSFPDGWTILPETLAANPNEPNPTPDSHRYAQMGNAVTVNVAHWLGERILAHD